MTNFILWPCAIQCSVTFDAKIHAPFGTSMVTTNQQVDALEFFPRARLVTDPPLGFHPVTYNLPKWTLVVD
jgi:hypothetical protein